jgi:hypothetical protein
MGEKHWLFVSELDYSDWIRSNGNLLCDDLYEPPLSPAARNPFVTNYENESESILNEFVLNNTIKVGLYNNNISYIVPVFFNTLGLTVHKFLYALRKIFLVE